MNAIHPMTVLEGTKNLGDAVRLLRMDRVLGQTFVWERHWIPVAVESSWRIQILCQH